MNTHFMPTTKTGKWSIGLFFVFILCLVAFLVLVTAGYRGDDSFFSFSALTIPALLGLSAAISGFVTGLISIIKSKERSVMIIVATVIEFFFLFLVCGEIIYPH
jgi:uncharacterized membrane protein YhdT